MLFATTSNGVYCCDVVGGEVRRVLGNRHSRGPFKPEARGYFGIARHTPSGQVLVASRERGFARLGKLANRVKLHLIDPKTLRASVLATVDDVHDVHQIAWHEGRVFLTDTGKNRIVVNNPGSGSRGIVNVGDVRDDVNHINAILVRDGVLYVGLNNRGIKPASLFRLSLSALDDALCAGGKPELSAIAERVGFNAVLHTHDLEPDASGKLFACISYAGSVFEVASERPILKVGDWTRGLAFGPDSLWVGTSELAGRKDRHSEKHDGAISLYSWPDLRQQDRLILHQAGQVNDLLYVED